MTGMNNQQNIFSICLFILICACSLLKAQDDISLFEEIKKEFPKENMVQIEQKYFYDISVKNDNIEVYKVAKSKYLYLKEAHTVSNNRSVFSTSFNELIDIEANSYIPNGKKYKKVKIKDFREKSNFDQDNFYDDVKEYVIPFTGIEPGTIVELNTKHKIHDPRLLNSVYVGWFFPIRSFEVEVACDNSIELDFIFKNFKNLPEKFQSEKGKKKTIYTWNQKNLKKIKYDRALPPQKYFVPHFIPMIRSAQINNVQKDILKDVNSLHKWYYTFIDSVEYGVEDSEMIQLVDSLTHGCTSDTEKVKTLFYWVQNNIKYISFEYGMDGYVPRKPDFIFKNKYGDCKDNSSLLYYLLKLSGVKSYLTWIGTQDIPYSYYDVPGPMSDNHMILTYINGEDYYFLDATGRFLAFGMPSDFIQGKEAFISKSATEFEIKKVPYYPAEKTKHCDSASFKIEDSKLIGKGHLTLTGYLRTNSQYILQKQDKIGKKKYIEAKTSKGNNQYVLNDYKTSDMDSYEDEFHIHYSFDINNYYRIIDSTLYLNLNLNKNSLGSKIEKDREYPFHLDHFKTSEYIYTFTIPEGYEIEYIPENSSFETQHYSYALSYTHDDRQIFYHHKVVINDNLIEKDEFEEWNTFFKKLENEYKKTLLFKKNEK